MFIRLPYREAHENRTFEPRHNFEQYVWTFFNGDSCYRLRKLLDVPTFRRVNHTSNYWVDKRFIYTDPYLSYPGQTYFFALGRVDEVHFLHDPDFARVKGSLYYRGVHIPGDTIPKSGHYP